MDYCYCDVIEKIFDHEIIMKSKDLEEHGGAGEICSHRTLEISPVSFSFLMRASDF